MSDEHDEMVTLATDLTVAWLANVNTKATAEQVPEVLRLMHDAVRSLGKSESVEAPSPPQAHDRMVTVRRSLADPERIISMIDGKPYASLKRHLAAHGLTPEDYRSRFKLKADYPMIAPGYSAKRREAATRIGLGRKISSASKGAIESVADAVGTSAKEKKPSRARGTRKVKGG